MSPLPLFARKFVRRALEAEAAEIRREFSREVRRLFAWTEIGSNRSRESDTTLTENAFARFRPGGDLEEYGERLRAAYPAALSQVAEGLRREAVAFGSGLDQAAAPGYRREVRLSHARCGRFIGRDPVSRFFVCPSCRQRWSHEVIANTVPLSAIGIRTVERAVPVQRPTDGHQMSIGRRDLPFPNSRCQVHERGPTPTRPKPLAAPPRFLPPQDPR